MGRLETLSACDGAVRTQAAVAGAALVGGRALMVNAVDGQAADYWRRRGFVPSKDDPMVLFRSISDIAASITAAVGLRAR